MTPREALARQPAPVHTEASESVTDALLGTRRLPPVVRALLVERRAQGAEVYGTELETHNGRDAGGDLLQELVDALVYAAQHALEHPSSARSARVVLIRELVNDVARELGVFADPDAGEEA